MRFRHPDGTLVHAAYCTNVHAAEDLAGVLAGARPAGAGDGPKIHIDPRVTAAGGNP